MQDSPFLTAARTTANTNGGPFANPFNESGIFLNDSQISSVDIGPSNSQKSMPIDFDKYDDVFKVANSEVDQSFNGSMKGIDFGRPASANPFNSQTAATTSETCVTMNNPAPSVANYDAFRFLAMDSPQQTIPLTAKSPARENGTGANVVKTVVDSNLFMDAAANAFMVFGKSPSNNSSPKKHENFDRNVEWNGKKDHFGHLDGKVIFLTNCFFVCVVS